MCPYKMIYKPSEESEECCVDVYQFYHTQDSEGTPVATYITAWVPENKTWITAPTWCFQPIQNKLLRE